MTFQVPFRRRNSWTKTIWRLESRKKSCHFRAAKNARVPNCSGVVQGQPTTKYRRRPGRTEACNLWWLVFDGFCSCLTSEQSRQICVPSEYRDHWCFQGSDILKFWLCSKGKMIVSAAGKLIQERVRLQFLNQNLKETIICFFKKTDKICPPLRGKYPWLFEFASWSCFSWICLISWISLVFSDFLKRW